MFPMKVLWFIILLHVATCGYLSSHFLGVGVASHGDDLTAREPRSERDFSFSSSAARSRSVTCAQRKANMQESGPGQPASRLGQPRIVLCCQQGQPRRPALPESLSSLEHMLQGLGPCVATAVTQSPGWCLTNKYQLPKNLPAVK